MATLPTCGPLLILPPALKRWAPPGGKSFVATGPTCGPHLILPPALKQWGPPRRQGLLCWGGGMIGGEGCRIKYVMWMDGLVPICVVCLAAVNTAAINTGFYPSGHFRLPTTCSY